MVCLIRDAKVCNNIIAYNIRQYKLTCYTTQIEKKNIQT